MAHNFQEITELLQTRDDSNGNLSKYVNEIPLVVHFDLANRLREQCSIGEDDIQWDFSFLSDDMPKSLPIYLICGGALRSESAMKDSGGAWASSLEAHRGTNIPSLAGSFPPISGSYNSLLRITLPRNPICLTA